MKISSVKIFRFFLAFVFCFGKETPATDVSSGHRLFHNFYASWTTRDWLNLALILDTGLQKMVTPNEYKFWGAAALLTQIKPWKKVNFGTRIEYFHDPDGVIILSGTANGFKTTGVSVNVDWKPIKYGMLRLEGRSLFGSDAHFITNSGSTTNSNFTLTSSLAMKF